MNGEAGNKASRTSSSRSPSGQRPGRNTAGAETAPAQTETEASKTLDESTPGTHKAVPGGGAGSTGGGSNGVAATSAGGGAGGGAGTGIANNSGAGTGTGTGTFTGTAMPGRNGRSKYSKVDRNSLHEMRKRVSAMLDFISRTQVEMAQEGHPLSVPITASATSVSTPAAGAAGNGSTPGRGSKEPVASVELAEADADAIIREGGDHKGTVEAADKADKADRAFAHLSSLEMMDFLTRDLVLWQKEYGKAGDKP